jgi:hypothetical protein
VAASTGFHEARRIVHEGLPITELAKLFRTSNQNVRRKLAGLKPAGDRSGDPIYNIADAAQYLVKPQVDLAEYIKTLRPADVPVAIQKQFWDAQNGRLKFMEDAKHLWHTARVQHAVGELFKLIRQRVQLLADTVERQAGLTDEQRQILEGISDGLLEDLYHEVREQFGALKVEGERDDVFENGPPAAHIVDDEEDDPFGGL